MDLLIAIQAQIREDQPGQDNPCCVISPENPAQGVGCGGVCLASNGPTFLIYQTNSFREGLSLPPHPLPPPVFVFLFHER